MTLYPWPGNFKTGEPEAPVAVVTLDERFRFPKDKVAIWGPMKTENLGIEKVVANVISNPNIRFLIVCGKEIRGHRSGASLLCLSEHGIDEDGRIIQAPGAVPYIENISREAIQRFMEQVEVVDMIGNTDMDDIMEQVEEANKSNPGSFGDPYIAIRIRERARSKFEAELALHSTIKVDPWGQIEPLEVS